MIFKATANYGSWIHSLQPGFFYGAWDKERHLKMEFKTGSALSGGIRTPNSRRCALGETHARNPAHFPQFMHLTIHLSSCWCVYICQAEYNGVRTDPCPHAKTMNFGGFLLLFWLEGGIMHGQWFAVYHFRVIFFFHPQFLVFCPTQYLLQILRLVNLSLS